MILYGSTTGSGATVWENTGGDLRVGYSVSALNLTGKKYADLIVGVPEATSEEISIGQVELWQGGSSGIVKTGHQIVTSTDLLPYPTTGDISDSQGLGISVA